MNKDYNEMSNVGSAKYVVNYHSGATHSDGSKFYDMRIFKNKVKKNAFIKQLELQGYKRS